MMHNPRLLVISSCAECGLMHRVTIYTKLCCHPKIKEERVQGREIPSADLPFPTWCPLEEVVG